MSERKQNRLKTMEELEKQGFKIKYEYIGDEISPRAGCCCLISYTDGDGIASIGVSICSLKDQFIKNKAKGKSFWRAYKAFKTKTTSEEISYLRKGKNWNNDFIQRSLKLKDGEDGLKVAEGILNMLNPLYIENQSIGKINFDDRKVYFQLPRNYNLYLVHEIYEFKSIYTY